jgi:hypothetical protein
MDDLAGAATGVDRHGASARGDHVDVESPDSGADRAGKRPRGVLGRLRRWGRGWVFTAFQLGLSVAGWVYVAVFAASMLLMVLIVGLLTVRAVLPLARLLANWSLAGAQWCRSRGETARIDATPGEGGLAIVVTALLRSPGTWKAVAYSLVNAVLLPVHGAALIVFPLAGLWARADAWLTVRWLGSALNPAQPSRSARVVGLNDFDSHDSGGFGDSGGPPGRLGEGRSGFGLTGMAERVAALGGQLTTGPTADGGFQVRAILPLPAPARDEKENQ